MSRLKIELFPFKNQRIRRACNIAFVILLLCSFHIHFYPLRVYYAIGRYFYQANTYWAGTMKAINLLEEREDAFTLSAPLPKDDILLVHIGESLRADHIPMNGYERNTMPRMMKEYKKGNLFNFPKALSFATVTMWSTIGMMTPASVPDPVVRSGSFVSLLKRAGVPCFSFFSFLSVATQNGKADKCMEVFTRTTERFYSLDLAHSLLPRFKSLFGRKDLKSCLVIYQGEGSHSPFGHYDPERFAVFTPVNHYRYADASTINAYDNTVVCTDDFIGSITDMLKSKSAVYIFSSDHGEMLGENGLWNRTEVCVMDNPHFRYVPFFIWVSDGFKAAHPEKVRILRSNAKRLSAVSHDNIYHTILGFFNIRNSAYDASLDLFSLEAKPFTGPFPEDLPQGTVLDNIKFETE